MMWWFRKCQSTIERHKSSSKRRSHSLLVIFFLLWQIKFWICNWIFYNLIIFIFNRFTFFFFFKYIKCKSINYITVCNMYLISFVFYVCYSRMNECFYFEPDEMNELHSNRKWSLDFSHIHPSWMLHMFLFTFRKIEISNSM